jgi:hypothetical protein
VCCSGGCCPDSTGGGSSCCATGYSCTKDGCCDDGKVILNGDGSKSCCAYDKCNDVCCGENQVCDSINKVCRTKCGGTLTCDPITEICSKVITDKDGNSIHDCSKKDKCIWDTDLIYDPHTIAGAPNTPLYADNDGTISWCQEGSGGPGREIAGNMIRKSHATTGPNNQCLKGNCIDKLSQLGMNFDIWNEVNGLCSGFITATDAATCNNTCPTGIKTTSCCKNTDGTYNGIVCPEITPLCINNVCYSGYSQGPDPNNSTMGYICNLAKDITPYNTLEGCQSDVSDLCIIYKDGKYHRYHYDITNNKCILKVPGEACDNEDECSGDAPIKCVSFEGGPYICV